jgi:DNA-directed RNA polymerase subunit RPC12/RpoP
MPSAQPPQAPETPAAVVPKPPPVGRKFPCSQCGAKLDFDPASRALKCPYCGHVEEIAPAAQKVQERDYEVALRKQAGEQALIPGRSSQVRCTGCGAVVLLEDKIETDQCPFCGTHLENKPEAAQAMIQPEAVLPFAVSDRQARAAFTEWVVARWFAPSELRQLANLGRLFGVYLPFWTYDAMTYTHYTGARGDNYWETETYTETDAQGQQVTQTRQVMRTRWYSVSGEVRHFFDDVLICGSRSLQDGEVQQLAPWELDRLEGSSPNS